MFVFAEKIQGLLGRQCERTTPVRPLCGLPQFTRVLVIHDDDHDLGSTHRDQWAVYPSTHLALSLSVWCLRNLSFTMHRWNNIMCTTSAVSPLNSILEMFLHECLWGHLILFRFYYVEWSLWCILSFLCKWTSWLFLVFISMTNETKLKDASLGVCVSGTS